MCFSTLSSIVFLSSLQPLLITDILALSLADTLFLYPLIDVLKDLYDFLQSADSIFSLLSHQFVFLKDVMMKFFFPLFMIKNKRIPARITFKTQLLINK